MAYINDTPRTHVVTKNRLPAFTREKSLQNRILMKFTVYMKVYKDRYQLSGVKLIP